MFKENLGKKLPEIKKLKKENSEFEFSPENPPSLETLETKIFAVHATPTFPKNGVLKAGARDISFNKIWGGEEPPSFRPTIHFALGELVREHRFSWENYPYAVISPLKNIKEQLINIFPNDTFILGDLRLQKGMVLLVPEGTDTSKIPPEVKIEKYNPEKTNLRQAIDKIISKNKGWHIQMKSERPDIDSVANIKNININDPKFFQSLFKENPHISFGTHIESEKGDAFRIGLIEQITSMAIKSYSEFGLKCSTAEISLFLSFITYNIQILEKKLKDAPLPEQAIKTFEEKKKKLFKWINIIKTDLKIRQRFNRTLCRAPEDIQKIIRKNKNNPEKLKKIINEICWQLPEVSPEKKKINPELLGEIFSSINFQELKEFIISNKEIFNNNHINLPEFYSCYAVARWLVIKNSRAQEEGLDELLAESLKKLPPKPEKEDKFFNFLSKYLKEDSNRLETALTILKNPIVKKYLISNKPLEENWPKNLYDVIKEHPKTKNLFKPWPIILSNKLKKGCHILNKLNQIYKIQTNLQEALKDFEKAQFLTLEINWTKERLAKDLRTVLTPMNSARKLDNILVGSEMNLYEVLRRDMNPVKIWRKLGLEKEYRQKFANDADFWQSSQSLLEIYEELQTNKKTAKSKAG